MHIFNAYMYTYYSSLRMSTVMLGAALENMGGHYCKLAIKHISYVYSFNNLVCAFTYAKVSAKHSILVCFIEFHTNECMTHIAFLIFTPKYCWIIYVPINGQTFVTLQ